MSEIWDFLQSPAGSAVLNMAVDEALLRTAAKRGRPLLRVYLWKQPSVSFGYFQKFPGHLTGKYEIARRPTGGGIVYHGDVDTTYSVVVPPTHLLYTMKTADAYCALHKAVGAALETQVPLYNTAGRSPRGEYECFQRPVLGDVVIDGRKVAGGAQRRSKWGVLHQGSIAAKLSAEQLKEGFRKALDVEFQPCTLFFEEIALSETLAREKYTTDQWSGKTELMESAGKQSQESATSGEPSSGED